MAQLFVNFWHALTAAGRSFALGTVEAWGFWSTTLLLLLVILFAATMINGIVWRAIEGRLRPKMRDRETETKLRKDILRLKAELYDSSQEQARLTDLSADQERVIEANRNWARNWSADAHQATARAR